MLRASEVAVTQVEHLWEHHVPRGMISLWEGKPGQGKSLATCRVASDVSHKAPVLFSPREDSLGSVVVPRLKASGANMDNVLFSEWNLPKDMDRLRGEITETGARLAILDPVASHISSSIYHEHSVRQILEPVIDMAKELDCAILMVSHRTKAANSAHPLEQIARMVCLYGTNPKDMHERFLVPVKSNVGPLPNALVLEVDDDGDGEHSFITRRERHTAKSLDGKVDETTFTVPRSKKEAAAVILTKVLKASGGELAIAEVRRKVIDSGQSWAAMKAVAEDMGLIATGRGTWAMPQALLELL